MKELFVLFATFFKMGLFTIGGGLAMIPLIQHTVVDKKGWLTEEKMVDCIAVSQSLPGVIAINVATYVGNAKRGFSGALAASFGVILPSFIIIISAVILIGTVGPNHIVEGAFTGIKAASCGLIAYAAYRQGKQVIKGRFGILIAVASFAAVVFFGVFAIWPIIFGGTAGLIFGRAK
ncbi:MAG: chromate transporter [Peptostreptococcaceae bacterium]|nr:chromate transporter [Peptostreptococcaceae bacterium]